MKYLGISFLVLASLSAVGAARAADDDPYAKNGVYFGVGASYGVPLFEPSLDNALNGLGVNDEHVSNSWGTNGRLGYRFHKYMAVEAEHEWFAHYGMRISGPFGSASLGDVSLQTVTGNFKVIAPFQRWQPYVLVGFGATFANSDKPNTGSPIKIQHTSYSTRFGLGLDYYLSENVALNFGSEFVVNTAKMTNLIDGTDTSRGLDYFSAQGGLVFKF